MTSLTIFFRPRRNTGEVSKMVKDISQLIPELPTLYFKILNQILWWVNISRKNLAMYSELYDSFI